MTGDVVVDQELLLPADAVLTPVAELEARLRAGIDCADDHVAVTRPGHRGGTRVVSPELARLLEEFRRPTTLVDGLLRFSLATGQHPLDVADDAFVPLQALAAAGVLVPAGVEEVVASEHRPGHEVAGYTVVRVVRALADSQLLEALAPDGRRVAVKLTSDSSGRGEVLADEAAVLRHLGGRHAPRLLSQGRDGDQDYLATEWCPGVPVTAAAARLRAEGDAGKGLHRLCAAVLSAYVELHAAGVLHGDVHPGNLLVADDGSVTILDFGRAWLGDTVTPGVRAGVPFFFEPELAAAVLAQEMPPPPTPAGEQYAVAALLYLLLTGDHHVEPSPEQTTLLERVVGTGPLPFTRRGCPAWPAVEAVLRQALASRPEDRYESLAGFLAAFTAAGSPPLFVAEPWADVDLAGSPVKRAWYLYRKGLAFDDPDALVEADVVLAVPDPGPGATALRALVAHARGDRAELALSARAFVDHPEPVGDTAMLRLSALLLDTGAEPERLVDLVTATVDRVGPGPTGPALLDACLRACAAAGLRVPLPLRARLDEVTAGRPDELVFLWCTAAEMLGDVRLTRRALDAGELVCGAGDDDEAQAFAVLRLYQHTGDPVWRERAVASASRSPLLAVELHHPEWAEPPLAPQDIHPATS